ncbi:MAG: DUF4476 domain-containing protein [Bacteroidota bacterium]
MKRSLTFLILAFVAMAPLFAGEIVIKSTEGQKIFVFLNKQRVANDPLFRVEVYDLYDEFYDIQVRFHRNRFPAQVFDHVRVPRDQRSFFVLQRVSRGNFGLKRLRTEPIAAHPQHFDDRFHPGDNAAPPCFDGMESYRFSEAIDAIRSQSFSRERMQMARQIVSSNCVSSRQVKRILKQFRFDKDQVAFAQFAYHKVVDPENYHVIFDVFDFSSSVNRVQDYMRNNPPPTRHYQEDRYDRPSPRQPRRPVPPPTRQYEDDYRGLSPRQFQRRLRDIEYANSQRQKLRLAEDLAETGLTTAQVGEILRVFRNESVRLDFAKYAYRFVLNPQNYYDLRPCFTRVDNAREFERFLRRQDRRYQGH